MLRITSASFSKQAQRWTAYLSGNPVNLPQEKKSKTVEFPCGQCGAECGDGTIQCDKCDSWFHGTCIAVDVASMGDDDEWLCPECK